MATEEAAARQERAQQAQEDAALAEVRKHEKATRIEDAVKGRKAARDVIKQKGRKG